MTKVSGIMPERPEALRGSVPRKHPREMNRPHVVILGAGASRACCPDGDANGRIVPLTDEIPTCIEYIGQLLRQCGIEYAGSDFEGAFSDIVESGLHTAQVTAIERAIRDDYGRLRLPDTPTIYDYLVLSLGPNDLIATFNWDPLIYQALRRCHVRGAMPRLALLHGSTAVGVCNEHHVLGGLGRPCPRCHVRLAPMKLVYPVRRKHYSDDPAISAQWDKVRTALEYAYFLTIFGYRAPSGDVDAKALMEGAWASNRVSNLAELNLIYGSKESAERQLHNWQAFVIGSHYSTHAAFSTSWLHNYPRRTCVALWQQTMELDFDTNPSPYPVCSTIAQLKKLVAPLVREERDVNFRARRWRKTLGHVSRFRPRRNVALAAAMRADLLEDVRYPHKPNVNRVIVRAVGDRTYYQDGDDVPTGGWFRGTLLGFYDDGIEIWGSGTRIELDEDGPWREVSPLIQSSPARTILDVHTVGRIPFSNIAGYDMRPNRWYADPKVRCFFNGERGPYETILHARAVRNTEDGYVLEGQFDENLRRE